MKIRRGGAPLDLGPVDARDWFTTVDDVPVCVNGHPLGGMNAYVRPDGWTSCRACHRDAARRHRVIRA